MTEHPITPPPELVQQWRDDWVDQSDRSGLWVGEYIATQAARWGADAELEACCEWVINTRVYDMTPNTLRAARRPKPPSLKEQALEALKHAEDGWRPVPVDCDIIRRALEQLDD